MCYRECEERITERDLARKYLNKEINRDELEYGLYGLYMDEVEYYKKKYEKLKESAEEEDIKERKQAKEFLEAYYSKQVAAIKWISFMSSPDNIRRSRKWIEENLNRSGCTMVMNQKGKFIIYQRKVPVGEIHFDMYGKVRYFSLTVANKFLRF